MLRLFGSSQRTIRVANGHERSRGLIQSNSSLRLSSGVIWPGLDTLLLQAASPFENSHDEIRRNAGRVSEALRQIEQEAVRGLGGSCERIFSPLALLVGDLPLLNSNLSLPKASPARREQR